jgi:hypothetical protein
MTAKIIEDPTYRECVFVFRDRHHAGKLLAEKLREYADKGNVILLALPAGGGSRRLCGREGTRHTDGRDGG